MLTKIIYENTTLKGSSINDIAQDLTIVDPLRLSPIVTIFNTTD